MAQAFRTQNLRLLGNLFDKNNSLGAKGYSLHSTGDGTAWQADLNEDSGILTGGVLSIGSGNTISVTAGTGQIYSRSVVSSEVVTTLTNVSWNAFTNVSLTYLATKQFTYLYIDQLGALIQSDSVFSDAVFKNYIVIGIVVHLNNSTVNAVINSQNAAYGDAHRLYELYNSFGPMKRAGLSLSSNGANLKINRSSGTALLIGCNYATDQFEPDIATITSYTDVKFARVRANGTGGFTFDSNSGSLYTAIDPNNYDNGTGTLASVTAGYWTIQRFYLFPNIIDRLVNYYGVATYATLTDALIALPNENFNESSFTARDAVFLGYVIVKQGVADLSSSSNAKFLQAGLSRSLSSSSASGGGSAVGVLDDLSDVQITTASGGQFLTYDSTTSLWKNRSYILDANNNELIKFPSTVASAVNEITISNAAASGSPSISVTGDDTNIGLNLISKGTGLIQINGKAISLANSFTTIGNFSLSFTTNGNTSLTLPATGILATTNDIPTVNNATLTLVGSGGIGIDSPPTFTANASADKTITISIADAALTIAKLENIATSRILGRTSALTGAVEILDGSGVASVIGTNAVARSTNLAAGIAGQIPYQSGPNTTSFSAAGTANQVLLSGGTGAPTWANQSSLSVGSATTAGSVTNALTISSPLTGTSYNGSAAVSIGLQNASDIQAGGVSIDAQTFAGNKTFKHNVVVSGNLTVNGSTVTINSSTLSVDDKNIELGAVIAVASLSSTVNIDAGDTNVIVSSTSGLIVGQALTKISGTGAFGVNPVISSITSATQFTVSPVHATTGSIIFSVGGATDVTADGGGITLKGTTDKTITWVDATDAWTLSEHINIANGKSYRINGADVLTATTLGSSVVNSSLTSVGTLANLTVTNTITGSVSGSAGSLSGTYTFWGQSFNGTQNVSGNLTSVGNITGSSGIIITAGGSNQNITLTPSGTGYTLLNGSVGIGNSTPNNKLTIQAGDNKDSGPIINLGGNAINQFESGRIRFTEIVTGATPFYEGAYLHYDGSNNLFHIGVHNTNDALIANDVNAISIVRSSANVGIGTTAPIASLEVYGMPASTTTLRQMLVLNTDYPSASGTGFGGSIVFRGRTAGNLLRDNAQITAYNEDIGDNGYALGFFTRPSDGGGLQQRITILRGGNVGIGITSPSGKLHVIGETITFKNGSDSQTTHFYIANAANTRAYNLQLNSAGTNLALWGYNSSNAWQNLVNFNYNGNVGIGNTAPSATLHVNSTTSGATLLRTDGTNGTLFSVVDDLSDSLMSVNNSAGLPVLEVFADDRVVMGQYGQNDFVVINNKVGLGTNSPINKLSVIGAASIGDSTYNISAPNNGLIVQGNVGIGTNNPSQLLEIKKTTGSAIALLNYNDVVKFNINASSGGAGYVGMVTNHPLIFVINDAEKWKITSTGIFESNGAQTIRTSIDSLTLATNGNNGHIVLSPHGNGNVGIGTASPVGKLHIEQIQNAESLITLKNDRQDLGDVPIFGISAQNGVTAVSKISFYRGGGGISGYLTFSTKVDNASSLTEKVRIDGAGNVGIGAVGPIAKLDVVSAPNAAGTIIRVRDTVTAGTESFAGIQFTSSPGTDYTIGKWSTAASAGLLQIRDQSGNQFVTVNSSGSVGIGIASPAATLDVNGTTFLRGNLDAGRTASLNVTTAVNGTGGGNREFVTFTGASATGFTGTDNVDQGYGYFAATIVSGKSYEVSATMVVTNGATLDWVTSTVLSSPSVPVQSIISSPVSNTIYRFVATANAAFVGLGFSWTSGTMTAVVSNFSIKEVSILVTSNSNVGIVTTSPTNTLDVNGTARIRSISASGSAATIFLSTGATGVLVSRTAAEVRSDIGAGTGNGTVTSVTASTPLTATTGNTPVISLSGIVPIANGGTGIDTTIANVFFVGPDGSTGAPSFRAMVSADIPNSIVSYSKIQNVNPNTVLGRITASVGIVEELSGANIAAIIGSSAITNASNVTIATDDTTNSSYYLYFGANVTGNTPLKASTKIRYNPSSGAFSATTKSFRIPHPTKPEHDLVYGSLESPYHGVRLTGKGKTNGVRAEIFLPDYIKFLIDENTVNVQITSYKCAKVFYVENINIQDNKIVIKYDKSWYERSKDFEFFWDFTAERKDVSKLIVEEKL